MISANKLENDILQYTIDGDLNENDMDIFATILKAMTSNQKSLILYGEIKNLTNLESIKKYFLNNGIAKSMRKKLKKYILICDTEVKELFETIHQRYFKNIHIEYFTQDQRELALAAVRS